MLTGLLTGGASTAALEDELETELDIVELRTCTQTEILFVPRWYKILGKSLFFLSAHNSGKPRCLFAVHFTVDLNKIQELCQFLIKSTEVDLANIWGSVLSQSIDMNFVPSTTPHSCL